MKRTGKLVRIDNKRYFSVNGSLLLPLALKWRLLLLMANAVLAVLVLPCAVSASASAASITMTVPSTLSVRVNPAVDNVFTKSNTSNVSVETDGLAGYTLTIESQNGNQLVNGSHYLNTLPEKTSEASYISDTKYNNTWGILPSKVDGKVNSDFLPGPTKETKITIDTTDAANKGKANTYDFTLGAKVDSTMAPGTYANTFIIVGTVNGIPIPETMQDFAKYDYCNKMILHQELTLIDTRDNSDYKVSKLADGKCWMVQNLRIVGRTITAEDSDLDSGSFVIPTSDVAKFTSTDFDNDAAYDSGDKDIGAYYTWHTATAGADPDVLWAQGIHDAPNSICPKGWDLTSAGDFGNYAALFYNYARQSYDKLYETVTASPGPNLKPSGYHNMDGTFQKDGQEGWYYSSTILVATGSGTHQVIGPQIVESSHKVNLITPGSTNRQNGRTIRCVTGNTPYSITYNANGDAITKNVDTQTGITKETTITLTKDEPARTGYAFAGWCNKAVTGTNCQDRIYQPGDTFLLGSDNNITLYAMWQQTSVATMQNFDCDTLKSDEVTVLLDTRDQNKYAVAKLKDGRCWMTQNLRLGGDTPVQLDSSSSDVAGDFTLPQSAVAASSAANVASIYAPGYGSNYGNYYNWYAATANSSVNSSYATGSICPKGWGLPSDSVYTNLINNYDKISVLQAPANFTILGQITVAGMFSDGGNFGRAWTNRYISSTSARALRIVPFMNDSNPLNSTGSQNPTLRLNVRCIAQQKYTIKYELNGGTGGPEPNPQTGNTNDTSITLDSKTPTKNDYTFVGWCSTDNTADPTQCSDTTYSAGKSYSLANGWDVTLYAIWSQNYSIKYELNGGTDGPQPNPQIGTTNENSVKLSNTAPTKQGYEFKGWCVNDTTDENCTGESYRPGALYPLAGNTTVTLHAMWQDIACIIDGRRVTEITDPRDSKTYTVATLSDGLCWMTQNLAIGSNDHETVIDYTNSDMDETSGDGTGHFTLPQGDRAAGTSSSGGWHGSQYNTAHIWIREGEKYGGFYTWYAATVGEGTGGSSGMASGDTQHSICPKGWRLPTGDEISTVTSGGNSSPNITTGNFNVYDSFCNENGCPNTGYAIGRWWSSTAGSTNFARALQYVHAGDFNCISTSKGVGLHVRCVAE